MSTKAITKSSHMVSTSSCAAPLRCLRYQLRRVLLHSRSHRTPPIIQPLDFKSARHIATSSPRYQEQGEDTLKSNKYREIVKPKRLGGKYKYPLGRIIGKAGRRQREGSAQLKIDALQRPFEVVVLKDVVEPKSSNEIAVSNAPRASEEAAGVSTAQLTSELAEGEDPTQDEVNESIDALRPDTRVVGDIWYYELLAKLKDGYNAEQLYQYLAKSLDLESFAGDKIRLIPEEAIRDKNRLKRSPWRPGETSLEKRRRVDTVLRKSEMQASHPKLAQQILRLAWRLATESEERSVGELELTLESWQLTYLFDLSIEETAMYRHVLQSRLLEDSALVKPYRPDNVLRITARRHIAEEVAERLEVGLRELESLEIDMSIFRPLLGKDGRLDKFDRIFDRSPLTHIQERTTTAIQWNNQSDLVIHGSSDSARDSARRLLLSFLELPLPSRTKGLESFHKQQKHCIVLPAILGSDVHPRYHNVILGRLSAPTTKVSQPGVVHSSSAAESESSDYGDGSAATERAAMARKIGDELSRFGSHSRTEALPRISGSDSNNRLSSYTPMVDSPASYWHTPIRGDTQPWDVLLCRFMQPCKTTEGYAVRQALSASKHKNKHRDSYGDAGSSSILQPDVPGVATLLSYFKQATRGLTTETNNPFLVAHLMPSPFTSSGLLPLQSLPRMEIRYSARRSEYNGSYLDIQIYSILAILSEQELRVPLPSESADLCFKRRIPLKPNLEAFRADTEIGYFTGLLRKSAKRGGDSFAGKPFVKIPLPRWLIEKTDVTTSPNASTEVEVEYMFERCEEIQSTDFVATRDPRLLLDMNPFMMALINQMPKFTSLRYREIDGGEIGGKTRELSIKYTKPYDRRLPPLTHTSEPPQSIEALVSEDGLQSASKDIDVQLAETGLRLANALTRINAGELPELGVQASDDSAYDGTNP